MMENKIIEEIVNDIRGEKISFLLGSGISINSGIPMVGGVKDDSIIDGIETYFLSKLGFSIERDGGQVSVPSFIFSKLHKNAPISTEKGPSSKRSS